MTNVLSAMAEAQRLFMDMVADVRPELHRYCTRMTGSVFDGEDVVQDTLAKAWYALARMETPPPLRPWLFRIAHNTAMDFVRRYENRNVDAVATMETAVDMIDAPETTNDGPDGDRVEAALKVFATLPPIQRSALALKDVLGLSLEETAATMDTSVLAVKGALVRARANVRLAASKAPHDGGAVDIERLRRYALMFNANDWDGLRALFGEETRLDLVSRFERKGQAASNYYTNYAGIAPREDLCARIGWVDDVALIAIFRPASSALPAYFIQLVWSDDELLSLIRDYRYVPYIANDATFNLINGACSPSRVGEHSS